MARTMCGAPSSTDSEVASVCTELYVRGVRLLRRMMDVASTLFPYYADSTAIDLRHCQPATSGLLTMVRAVSVLRGVLKPG